MTKTILMTSCSKSWFIYFIKT